uniref:heat shock 70 kDa protein 14-like n=1 Tax=Styela clava TaxID=7725 RepID=UPI001939DDF3|nr:heat shock 70 kDa protein 14-like [Styela clava]
MSIGVHLGNTSACIAVSKNGKVDVVANSHGDRLTPAMVTFLADETLVGFSSKQVAHRYIQETVRHANSLLGKRMDNHSGKEMNGTQDDMGFSLNEDGMLVFNVKHGQKNISHSANHIVKLILENIFETARSQAGNDVNEVVVSAPIGYTSSYRDALTDAASNAGFEVLRVISEPSAAALAYGVGMDATETLPYQVLVFRAGGITEDATLLEVCNGMICIKKYITKQYGGDVLTEDIANHFASIFERENRMSVAQNKRAMSKLKTHSEKCKHVLSTMPSASCHIDSLYDGRDFNGNISRSRFEMLVNDHLQALVAPIKEILFDTDANDIKKVIMCGGTSNIPRLQDMVSKLLPKSEMLSSIPPSEVIAFGNATEAGLLINLDNTELADEDCEIPAAPVDIYLNLLDKTDLVIKEKTFLPFTVDEDYLIPLDKTECSVQILFKDSTQSEDSEFQKLSEITLDKLTPGSCLHVHLKYFANGHLHFTCLDKDSGNTKTLTIGS